MQDKIKVNHQPCICVHSYACYTPEVEEPLLHWSGKSVKAVKHKQLSTFTY